MAFKKGNIPWNKVNIPKEDIEACLAKAMSAVQIGRELGFGSTTILNKMKEYGLRPTARRHQAYWDKEMLRHMYYDEEKSTSEIGKEFGVCGAVIRTVMNKLGIPRRSISEAEKLRVKRVGHPNNWKGGRIKRDGYVVIFKPSHPYASSKGYILEHRLVMERKLGRYLMPWEKVHHIDGVKTHNSEDNLQLLSPSDHNIIEAICQNCPLRKEVRLLRWQIKQLREDLQYKFNERI